MRNGIFPVVFYGYEIWFLILREEHRLRVFENRVLRKVFGSKRDEVTGKWKRLHNEEPCNLYSSPNTLWVMKSIIMIWAGHVARMEWRRGAYMVLVGTSVRERHHLDDLDVGGRIILKWIFKKLDRGMHWFDLAENSDRWPAFANTLLNLWFS
jgi:hypothetical protein